MARKKTVLSALKWDLVLLGIIVLGAGLVMALEHPHFEPATSEMTTGSRPPDRIEGDVLLLLPDSPAAAAHDFSELDCSYGWYNSLWQQFGSFATALNRNLSPEMLAGRSVVIVPKRVAEAMPATGISALAGFARTGGQVIVEQPGSGWEHLTGLSTQGKLRQARAITAIDGLQVHGAMRRHLPNTPLIGSLLPTPALANFPGGPTLLEVDAQPGLTVNPLGRGQVYTFLFNFGCTITGLQQGKPTEAMRFGHEPGQQRLPVDARAADERMLTSHVPYSDLLERAVFNRLSKMRPLPRLWMFPGQKAGSLMLSHPTPSHLRAAIGYADFARQDHGSSTVFVASDLVTPTETNLLKQAGAEVGLLWTVGEQRAPITEAVGVGAIRPILRELSLAEQRLQLANTLVGAANSAPGDADITMGRVEGSLFDNDWATTFRQLRRAGMKLDASFGPTDPEHYGYLFGSGFPFYPIDGRGLPVPLLEFPFLLEGANANTERLDRILANSEAYFHQPVHVSLPADAMRTAPAAGILLTFKDAFKMAEARNHWVTTLAEFYDFLSARRQSVLTSQWAPEHRRLTISVHMIGARVASMEGGANAGVAFPRVYDGQEVERVEIDNAEISLRRLATTGDGYERIVEVTPGHHTISVFYKMPPAAGDPAAGEAEAPAN
ncbi:hypothetical protein [Bradymonas sediminis]|uniref:Uncharacterized protein n=1 Tax=Bradymonas sediminis TaxID=1548548 RepID=A0A2Z4FM53_9DELT|nr:hypothetical protein [Bradymonas sediminis]AWV90012.1 hypothetical protein DN745_11945 [Bradymonas sediminis]TDP76033.1 hypothetical protein DFR33_103384 [Bradymonas sediminis]